MPSITIELTEEQAACLWADNWETGDVSEIARKILKSSAEKYASSFPGSIPDTITRYRQQHPDIPATAPSIPTPPLLEIQPGDIILIESPKLLPKEITSTIQEKTKALFPGHQVVVFSGGLHLTAIRPQTEDGKTEDTRQEFKPDAAPEDIPSPQPRQI